MSQEDVMKQRIFLLDYDNTDDAEILANIVILDISVFEHEIALRCKHYAKNIGKEMKDDAIKNMLIEAYQRRISCLMSMEGKNGN